jgi:hypothetical protein
MRTFLLAVTLVATAGCAGVNRSAGISGGAAVSGETKTSSAASGADTNSIATSGSEPADPASRRM